MGGLYDGMDIVPASAGPAPAAPPFPKNPVAGLYDGLEEVPGGSTVAAPPREASGLLENIQAGFQGSAPGLAWRRKLPDLITNPETASWWERAASGITHVASELPLMIGGAIVGAPAGGAVGGAVAGPPGAAAGTVLGAGFGMGVVPAAIRTAYVEALKAGEVKDAGDFWNILREVAIASAKEGGINAVAMGGGALAGRALGAAIAPSIGTSMGVKTATAAIETADIATQIALMPTIPAALAGRLPAAHEFLDAAILIGGLKAAHVTATNITSVFLRTGKTPAEQVADAQAKPEVARDLSTEPARESRAEVPIPRTPDGRVDMPTIQEALFAETARVDELELKARSDATPLSDAERVELEGLKAKVADLERQLAAGAAATTIPVDAAPRYAPEQLVDARKMAEARIAELNAKAEESALTDTERAQRVFLTNSLDKPDALAMHFKLEPTGGRVPTAQEREASAQRVYEDVLQQVKAADEARRQAGLEPLGDEHAEAVAALVRARVRTRAARLGRLPEEIYNEKPLQIRDETAAGLGERVATKLAEDETLLVPGEAAGEPLPPETDLFGEPIVPPKPENYTVENLVTQEIPLANLVLSKEVPQFKMQADANGVVVQLGGKFDRTGVGPIQVWERLDGTLEVISGRHRLDLARRSGEATIPAQIHREAEGFDARQAATLDAQLNIREEQGSVADYAQYFKDAGISKDAAEERGLLARAKGRIGFAIARDGSPDLLQAHRAGKLTDEAALAISAAAPGSDRLQALGMVQVQQGKSILFAVNTMRAVDLMAAERMAAGQQGDIFGFDDSAMREAAAMAKKASSKQRAISEQIAAVSGASKRPELARKMGVNVEDPEGIQKKIAELKQEQYLWDNWPLYPELVAQLRTLSQGPARERAPEARDWRDAPTEESAYFKDREIYDLEANPYIEDGLVKASSRTMPNPNTFPPVGAWRISELNGAYGREIEQLVELPISRLKLNELDSEGQLDPTKRGDDERYAEWLKEGKRAPPINVVQTDRGTLSVTDGHRRVLAAKKAGKDTIEAWVNYAVPTPSGSRFNGDPTKPFIRTGMTYEMLVGEVPNKYLDRIPIEFDLKAETPAELEARNREAAASAARKMQADQQAAESLARYWGARTWKNEAEAREMIRGRIIEDNERYPMFSATDPAIADLITFTKAKGGQVKVKTKPKPLPQVAWSEEPPKGEQLPPVDWTARDMADNGTPDSIKKEYGRDAGNLYRAWVPIGELPKARGEDITDGRLDEDSGARHELAFRGEPPPLKVRIGPRGKVEILDGNHRLAWWSEQGYDHVPAWVLDERPAKYQPEDNTLYQSKRPETWWYSALARQVDSASMKAAPAQGWKDWLKGQMGKGAIKAEEIKWSGLEEWLDLQVDNRPEIALPTDRIDPISEKTVYELGPNPAYGKSKITKEAVATYLKTGGVRVDEVMLGKEGEPNLGDSKIAADMETLRQAGWDVETPPDVDDFAYVAFRDPDGNVEDAADLNRYAVEDASLQPIAEAATRIFNHIQSGPKGAPPTKFSQYALPGGKNYRELLLTLPTQAPGYSIAQDRGGYWRVVRPNGEMIEGVNERWADPADARRAMAEYAGAGVSDATTFRSSHFPEDNILAHVRFNERTDAEGKRVLFIEEFQSDWAQQGRKKGFLGELPPGWKIEEVKNGPLRFGSHDYFRLVTPQGEEAAVNTSRQPLIENAATREGASTPSAPFVTKTDSWVQLVVKRMVAYAAENGFDKIAWTRGEQQVERYTSALRKAVDAIEWEKTPEGVHLVGYKGRGTVDPALPARIDRQERNVAALARAADEELADVGDRVNGDYRKLIGKPKRVTGRNPITGNDIEPGWAELNYLDGAGLIIETPEGNYEVPTGNMSGNTFDNLASAERYLFFNWVATEQPTAVLAQTDLTPALRIGMQEYVNTVEHFMREHRELQALRERAKKGPGKGTKVVDTTEGETSLSDAIGKAMADRIINDPAQSGTIEGENIKVDSTGMAGFYDRMLPNVVKDVAKKLGGGKITETKLEIGGGNDRVDINHALTREEIPSMGLMPESMRDAFAGAEDFPDLPSAPIIGETKIMINGEATDATVTADLNGVHIITGDGDNEFLVPASTFIAIGARWKNATDARRAIEENWRDPQGHLWGNIHHIVGDAQVGPFQSKDAGLSTHQSIDISPAMREKAMQGLPLFQDPNSPRGSYQIAANLITTLQGADKSTVVHELGHSWLEEIKADAMREDAPAQIKADWDILRAELAIGADGRISRESHEQWARTVERYLAEGEAPSIELRSVFERFKAWLLEIYQSLGNLKATVNPELKGILDRMLATDEEIAAANELGVPRAYAPEAAAGRAAEIVPPPEPRRKIQPDARAEELAKQPFADELPAGPGEAPDTSRVNYAYINSPMDVKLAMQRMAEIDQAAIQAQRGGTEGVKSWAEANAEQARYLNDILGGNEDTLKLLQPRDPNAPHVDVRLGILKKLAVGAAKDSARLRDVILEKGHDATVREQLEYLGSIERARMIQAEFLGERASVARALNALKDATEGSGEIGRMLEAIGLGDDATLHQAARTPAEEQAYLKAQLDQILLNYRGRTVLDIAKLHKEIGTLKGSFKFAEETTKATKWEMVVEGWRAGLLSGPVTHTTNLFGTGAFHVMRAPVDALAAMIGVARGASPGMGETDRASMSEAVARLTGMLGGIQDGMRVAWHTYNLDEPTGKTESYRTAIPGRAGDIIRIPLRLMGAEDALVSTMYRRGELRTLAIRQAFDENMNPSTREFAERVDYLLDHPTPEMQAVADDAATRMTFNMPLGEKGMALTLFVNKWNLQWMIPFIRTPINIAKELLRMSPFSPAIAEWRADIAKGGVARDRALAEMAIGTGIMALTMAAAFNGQISGHGSPDPGKNRAKVGVWQPYSVLIGDTWYEYARIQPTGTLMGMAADIATIWDHMDDEEKNQAPKLLAAAFAQAITNQTFLQGITNVVNATSDPVRFGPRFLQQFAGSLVPNVIGQPTTMADPVVREVNSMLEAIESRIPGLRQDLLPKRDWLGQPVQTKERLGMVMPIREQKVSEDKVRQEADRLELSMAAAPKKTHIGKGTGKLGDVELTPEERDIFAKTGGEFAHKILQNIVNAPGYDEMPDMVKRRVFSKVLEASHRIAAVAAMPPEKRVAYLQSISEKVANELTPGVEQ